MVLDFCPFGCLLSSFSAAFCRFPSFWLPFVSFFGCFLSNSVLLAAFCLLFGCLLGLLLPPQSLKYWFWNLWFWISVLLAAFCLPFRLLFVDFRPFGCLVGPAAPSAVLLILVLKFMVLDFCPFGCLFSSFSAAFCRFPSFWLPFVSFFGCFLSNYVLLAAFCLLFGCLVGPAALSAVP